MFRGVLATALLCVLSGSTRANPAGVPVDAVVLTPATSGTLVDARECAGCAPVDADSDCLAEALQCFVRVVSAELVAAGTPSVLRNELTCNNCPEHRLVASPSRFRAPPATSSRRPNPRPRAWRRPWG